MKKPACRSCDAASTYQFVRAEHVFGSDGTHKFWQCEKCGLVYLWPIPSIEEDEKFYAQEFEKFMETRTVGTGNWSGPEAHLKINQDQVKRRWKFLRDYLKTGDDVLEIGCSSGFMMDAFKKAGLNPIGIEPSDRFSKFLGERGHISYSSMDELLDDRPQMNFDLIVHFFCS